MSPERSLRILVIEDDILVALDVAETLQAAGHNVIGIADDVAEALQIDAVRPPDLALVDLHLVRGQHGPEVAASLQERGIHCLFVSGSVPEPEAEKYALGCLQKPFNPRALVEAIRVVDDVLSGKEPRQQPPNLRLFPHALKSATVS